MSKSKSIELKFGIFLKFIVCIISLLTPTTILAQADPVSGMWLIGGGLTTMTILGDNIAKNPLAVFQPNPNDQSPRDVGASFIGQQSGFGLRLTHSDQDRILKFPFGVDVSFFSGRDRVVISNTTRIFLKNDLTTFSGVAGLEYAFAKLPLARANIYIATDLRALVVPSSSYLVSIEYDEFPTRNSTSEGLTKDLAFRLGGSLRLGVDGQIDINGDKKSPWFVNISSGLSWMNLIGLNNDRGELLTPSPNKIAELKENIVNNFFVNIFVYYKL